MGFKDFEAAQLQCYLPCDVALSVEYFLPSSYGLQSGLVFNCQNHDNQNPVDKAVRSPGTVGNTN